MNSCLRSNLLTALAMLLFSDGSWRMQMTSLEGKATATQAHYEKVLADLIEENATATRANLVAAEAHRVAAAVEAGMCFVNSQNVRDLRQPFGGTKASGTGREGGTWSYEVFLEPKNVAVSLGSHHIPHWGV